MAANIGQLVASPFVEEMDLELPVIEDDDSLGDIVQKLSKYIVAVLPDVTVSFEQMSSSLIGQQLRPLIVSLSDNVHNHSLVSALMVLKWQFHNIPDDEAGVSESRGYACEYIAWQFVTFLSRRETVDFLLQELREPRREHGNIQAAERGLAGFPFLEDDHIIRDDAHERTPLLASSASSIRRLFLGDRSAFEQHIGIRGPESTFGALMVDNRYSLFNGLSALEIATIANAKKFLSQKVVQSVINDIWRGEIVFWDTLSVHSKKCPKIHNKRTEDPFSRLRVPRYRKAFEAAFFVSFLVIYYALLVERNPSAISFIEVLMYVWIAAFAYDEFSGISDAGMLLYRMDFWSLWNIGIIGTGMIFVVTRIVGLAKDSDYITDLSFDILSLEALFLLPRICSLVSLNSYFGSLIPVLKEMTKAFLNFMPIVIVLYLGFLTTFTMLARDRLTLRETSSVLVKVFFGSTQLGFDISKNISPVFGYPLMLIFVAMTNILLISSLISLMSLSLEGVMAHAREEYLFQLSIYVLESSNSRRLTYFLPPLNLIPLLFIRPMRLFLSASTLRRLRIVALKITHLPFIAIILAYETTQPDRLRPSTQTPPTPGGFLPRPGASGRSDSPANSRHRNPAGLSGGGQAMSPRRFTDSPGRSHAETHGSDPALVESGLDVLMDEMEKMRSQMEKVVAITLAKSRQESKTS